MEPDRAGELCSICCLSYNHEPYIKPAIKSLWNQEYKNIEIIVVDDGSSDASPKILEKLSSESPVPMKVIVNRKNTANIGANFNKAFEESKGKFIAFMSLDDVLYNNAISSKISKMQDNGNIAFIANSVTSIIDEKGAITAYNSSYELDKIVHPTLNDLLYLEYAHMHSFFIQGTIFRRDVVKAVEGFDEDMTGDDIVLRTKVFNYALKEGLSFEIQHFPACYYRIHSLNIHKNRYRQVKIIAAYLERYHKGRPLPEAFIKYFNSTIKTVGWADVSRLFKINDVTRRFLYNPRTWIKILKKCVRSLYQ